MSRDVAVYEEVDLRLHHAPRLAQHLQHELRGEDELVPIEQAAARELVHLVGVRVRGRVRGRGRGRGRGRVRVRVRVRG